MQLNIKVNFINLKIRLWQEKLLLLISNQKIQYSIIYKKLDSINKIGSSRERRDSCRTNPFDLRRKAIVKLKSIKKLELMRTQLRVTTCNQEALWWWSYSWEVDDCLFILYSRSVFIFIYVEVYLFKLLW